MARKTEESTVKRLRFTAAQLKEWTEVVDISEVQPHPQNPNNGDQERLNKSIERHGQFRTTIISADGYHLAGNHTYAGLMEKGVKEIAVIRLPLMHDHPQALEIMLADNHIGRKGRDDKGLLEALLGQIREEQGEVIGAGFTDQEFDRLLQDNSESADPGVMTMEYKVVVDCRDEEHQVELLEQFEQMGLQCKALIA